MSNITVDFDSKTQRLQMAGAFHLLDVLRSFPSRRWNPKSQTWLVPLVKANVCHMNDMKHKVQFDLTPAAVQAVVDLEKLTAPPVHAPFPTSWFEGKQWQPMPHQFMMLDRGWSLKGYALFAVMGTGKSYVTVQIALARHAQGLVDRLVVVCPQTLRRTWRREFSKYGDPDTFVIRDHETKASYERWLEEDPKKLHILLVGVEGLGISSKYYDALLPFLTGTRKAMAVCDESSRIKNPKAVRTERCIAIGAACAYRMILNGTPIALGLQDLWSQFEFVDPNIIGSGDYWAFKSRYVMMGGYENKKIVGFSNVEELMSLVRPYSLEVNKEVLNLPPKLYKQIAIEPTPVQSQLFKKIKDGFGEGAFIKVENVLERMLRNQQVIGGFEPQTDPDTMDTTTVALSDNPKLDALLDIIESNFETSKFIIWARYIPEIHMLREALSAKYGSRSVVDFFGGTTKEQRAIAEDRYCTDKTCRFLIGNPSAAGLGLTLIGGESDVMIYYSGTFAYIDRAQSEDRSHRIGQKNTVTIVDLVMEKSIDVTIQKAIAAKTDLDKYVKDQIALGIDPFS